MHDRETPVAFEAVRQREKISDLLICGSYSRPFITQQHNALGRGKVLFDIAAHGTNSLRTIARAVVSVSARVGEYPCRATRQRDRLLSGSQNLAFFGAFRIAGPRLLEAHRNLLQLVRSSFK